MGVADRDWYRDAHERIERGSLRGRPPLRAGARPSWTHRPPDTRWLGWVLVLAVVFALGWTAREWSQRSRSRPPRVVVDLTERPLIAPMAPLQTQTGVGRAVPERVETAPSPTVVVARCVVDGRTAYGDRACAQGRTQTLEVDRESPPNGSASRLTPYQAEMLRSADARIARDLRQAWLDRQASQNAFASSTSECEAIRAAIQSLDSAARQPLSGSSQDSIRQQRMALTTRAGQLRC